MRRIMTGVLVICIIFSLDISLQGGESLDAIFKNVAAVPWKANAASIKRSLHVEPLFETKNIMIAAGQIADRHATVNYLFNQSGALYNISWYLTIPTTELDIARAFERTLEAELTAKYGKPVYVFSDGDPTSAEQVAAQAAKLAALMAPKGKSMQPTPPDGSRAFAIDKNGNFVIPMIFYSKLNFWNGGKFWAYTNLLCSTDGKCYVHLQFVSKALTKREGYAPNHKQPFAYSPLDRDQDMVTKHNDMMEYNRTLKSGNRSQLF